MKSVSALSAQIEAHRKTIKNIEVLLPKQELELKNSFLFRSLVTDLKNESEVDQALHAMEERLEKKRQTRLQLEAEIKQSLQSLHDSQSRLISAISMNLNQYLKVFNDPNLPYNLSIDFSPDRFLSEWIEAQTRLRQTELPQAQEKWKRFFNQVLMDSVKDTINEIKSKIHEVERSIKSINDVLKLTNFEDLPTEKRYLKIDVQASTDDRVRKFRRSISEIEKILGPSIRANIEEQSQGVMDVLLPFVEELQKETTYRMFVTDVRNHFQFQVHSLRREEGGEDVIVETFTGARKDAKSSAQTTQLAYALLASCLAYRFKFHDPVGGQETPRLLVLDEFGGKFDNEKPRDILKLLDKMGFQSILVSPMAKADLLAEGISHMVLVHKVSASRSKVQSYPISSRQDYERLIGRSEIPTL
jgi:uncharacterized protein YPO0396